MRTRTTAARFIAVAILAVSLAACAQQADDTSDIATIDQPGASSSNGSAAAEDRPRLRLDMTDAESEALYAAYDECLSENGGSGKAGAETGGDSDSTSTAGDDSGYAEAQSACAALDPLPAWETDRNNPDAMDFMTDVVACLKDKGVKFVEIGADQSSPSIGIDLGGPQNDMDSIIKGMDLIPTCEAEVSAAQQE